MAHPKAVIFGCDSTHLSEEEERFFQETQPLGFILFARNIESPEQVKALVAELKATVTHANVPILIDQEGGRVARLRPPHWREYPAAYNFAELAKKNLESAQRAIYLNARLMANDLSALGINVNCAPMVDLRLEGAHDIVGDRALGTCAEEIVPLAREQARGLMDGGVVPVLKHIPGHGRALADSHKELPVVDVDMDVLRATDFKPFQTLSDLPMGMTAHIRYEAIDADLPSTLSSKTISTIRDEIGFDGLLMSDDIGMKALDGDIADIARQSIEAGCDVALHCNGDLPERCRVAAQVPEMTEQAFERSQKAFSSLPASQKVDVEVMETELASLMEGIKPVTNGLSDPTAYDTDRSDRKKRG